MLINSFSYNSWIIYHIIKILVVYNPCNNGLNSYPYSLKAGKNKFNDIAKEYDSNEDKENPKCNIVEDNENKNSYIINK